MKLSHLQDPRRVGLSSHSYETKSWYQLTQIKAPVEPIAKFCQIPGKCFSLIAWKVPRNEFFTLPIMVLIHLNSGICTLSGSLPVMIAV